MSARPTPARVFGFVAADADVCVLLRRGSTKGTLMVRWDLTTDTFEIGQWLMGAVHGGELSPDGRLFAYKALKKAPYTPGTRLYSYSNSLNYSYSVVCRPPFFTALAFWDDREESRWLRWTDQPPEKPVTKPHKGTLPDAYRTHLTRVDQIPKDDRPRPSVVGELVVYWELGWDRFYSLDDELLEADWASVDRRGRLLVSRKGRIFVRDEEGERELIDLNPYEFRPMKPPGWAKNWP